MSKISEKQFLAEKKPCGVAPQQNKGWKHIPDHSRPNSDQIISKNSYFYSNFIENRGFSIKIAKKFKIVAKALLRVGSCKQQPAPGTWSAKCCLPLMVTSHYYTVSARSKHAILKSFRSVLEPELYWTTIFYIKIDICFYLDHDV